MDKIYEEAAFIGYYMRWSHWEIIGLSHRGRLRVEGAGIILPWFIRRLAARQEYTIRQEWIEREELRRRLKKQESRLDASQSGTEGEISARPNGQLSQKVADQLKEQLRLDRIRYGADWNKGQDTREAFETAYRALMDILGKI